jgi:hypothetical protein
LSEIRSSSWRLGQPARNASYSTFACARFSAALIVGIAAPSYRAVRYALRGAYFPLESITSIMDEQH